MQLFLSKLFILKCADYRMQWQAAKFLNEMGFNKKKSNNRPTINTNIKLFYF